MQNSYVPPGATGCDEIILGSKLSKMTPSAATSKEALTRCSLSIGKNASTIESIWSCVIKGLQLIGVVLATLSAALCTDILLSSMSFFKYDISTLPTGVSDIATIPLVPFGPPLVVRAMQAFRVSLLTGSSITTNPHVPDSNPIP
jgi:hypothetical protein